MQAVPQIALWVIGLFGGAKMVEHTLENFLMNQPWMPDWAKKYIVPVGSVLAAVVANVYGGMDPLSAFMLAIGAGGTVSLIHDVPALSSASLATALPDKAPDEK